MKEDLMPVSMKKRVTAAVAAVAAAAMLIPMSACGNSSSASSSSSHVTLKVWGWEPLLKKVIPGFEKQNPHITVKLTNAGTNKDEYTALSNAIKAGNGAPDLVQLDYNAVPQFALTGGIQPLDSFGAKSVMAKMTKGASSSVTINGKVYGMPLGTGPMALFYNKSVFDKAGIANPPKTWDEFYEDAKKIRATGNYITSDTGDAGFAMSMMWLAGGHPFSVNGKNLTINLTKDKGVQAFAAFWQKMISEKLIDTKTTGWSEDWYKALGNGQIASLMTGAWMPISLESGVKAANGQYRVALMPTPDGKTANSENGGGALAVVKGTKVADAAYKFAKYVAIGGGNKTFTQGRSFPPDTATLTDPQYLNQTSSYFGGQKINSILAQASSDVKTNFQFLPFQVYANDIYADTVGQAFTGQATMQKGLAEWQAKLVSYAKQQGYSVKE